MASRKQLKKDINNEIGSFIEEIYHWELSHPGADLKKSEALIDEAISAFDTIIAKINGVDKKAAKQQFKSLNEEISTTLNGLETQLAAL